MNTSAILSTAALLTMLGAGCSTAPAVKPGASLADGGGQGAPLLHPGDSIMVSLRSTTTNIALLEDDAVRVADKIHRRFESAGPAAVIASSGSGYAVDIDIVNYSKGYDFIRAMLPYTGQIRVDAQVRIRRMPAGTQVGLLTVSKTYDPGEINSSASHIEDIEEPFVQAVVEALRGPSSSVPSGGA